MGAAVMAFRRSVVQPVVLLVVLFVVLVVLFYAVFPTQTFLDQRSSIGEARSELSTLRDENQALRTRLEVLTQPEEIERLARSEYNLIYPGEEAYAILPPAPAPVEIADVWPLNVLVASLTSR